MLAYVRFFFCGRNWKCYKLLWYLDDLNYISIKIASFLTPKLCNLSKIPPHPLTLFLSRHCIWKYLVSVKKKTLNYRLNHSVGTIESPVCSHGHRKITCLSVFRVFFRLFAICCSSKWYKRWLNKIYMHATANSNSNNGLSLRFPAWLLKRLHHQTTFPIFTWEIRYLAQVLILFCMFLFLQIALAGKSNWGDRLKFTLSNAWKCEGTAHTHIVYLYVYR